MLIKKQVENERYKVDKYAFGMFVLPAFPLLVYFLDFYVFEAKMSDLFADIATFLGLEIEQTLNFWGGDYQRTVYFLTLILFPFFAFYWMKTCEEEKIKCESFGAFIKTSGSLVFIFLLLTLPSLLPVSLSENPSKREIAIFKVHNNKYLFTFTLYWFLHLSFMLLVLLAKLTIYARKRNFFNC